MCYLSTLTIDLEALDPDWKSIIDLRNNESFILLSCFLWMPGTVNVEVKLDDDWESQTFYVAICLGRLPIKQFPRLFALDYNMHLVCCPSCFIMYSFVDFFFHDSLFKFVQMKKIKVWAVVWYYNWKLTDYKAREWLLMLLIRVQINQAMCGWVTELFGFNLKTKHWFGWKEKSHEYKFWWTWCIQAAN